jgi:Zn-dependent peptidase ImmA (M78 family)
MPTRQRATAINPLMLRWARERSGMTLAEVAARFKKAPDTIENWESGADAPTFRQFEQLAEQLYKRPLAIFFFPSPPEEEDAGSRFRTLPQSEVEALEPDTRYALREALAFQESIRELTAGIRASTALVVRDIRPLPHEPVEQLAGRVRYYLGVPLDTQFTWRGSEDAFKQWRRSVESVGVFALKRSFKQNDVFGFCLSDDAFPIIIINNSTAHSRQVFTLFHELAHLLYSVSSITMQDMTFIDHLSGRSHDIEVLCNRFAAEFLVPSSSFPWADFRRANLDTFVRSQATRYNTSREVILRRLLDRGLVSQGVYQRKSAQWNAEYLNSRQGRAGGNYYATHAAYLGETFLRLAFTQYRLGKLSLDELADHLRIKGRNVGRFEDFVVKGEQA